MRLLAAAAFVAVLGAPIEASAGGPTLRLDLLTSYEACTTPNATVADSFPATFAAACAPPVRSDATCGFGPNGSGQVGIAVARRGVRVRARLSGLTAGCEGQLLTLRVGARATTAACSPGPCTVGDADSADLFPARPCLVTDGSCSMSGEMPKTDLPRSSIVVSTSAIVVMRGAVTTFVAGVRFPTGTRTP